MAKELLIETPTEQEYNRVIAIAKEFGYNYQGDRDEEPNYEEDGVAGIALLSNGGRIQAVDYDTYDKGLKIGKKFYNLSNSVMLPEIEELVPDVAVFVSTKSEYEDVLVKAESMGYEWVEGSDSKPFWGKDDIAIVSLNGGLSIQYADTEDSVYARVQATVNKDPEEFVTTYAQTFLSEGIPDESEVLATEDEVKETFFNSFMNRLSEGLEDD